MVEATQQPGEAASTTQEQEQTKVPVSDSAANSTAGDQVQPAKGLTRLEKINELQQIPNRIRNICILAHVDHGKTTLSDTLICGESNNIISQKLAGTLRYLDDREDEQNRMITMKASSISILHNYKQPPKKKGDQPTEQHHLVNLIDSPGHVDFSIEVSSAVSLSDGALVLIDCIEGVSPQTTTVIRQAWEAKVKTCLVINKLDRLIVDKWYDAKEVYTAVYQIIENANSYLSELIQGDHMRKQEDQLKRDRRLSSNNSSGSEKMTDAELEAAEQEYLYSPEKGNVAFCSALDNWGFSLDTLCPRIAKNFGMNAGALKRFMWGKYYYISSQKKIVKVPPRDDSNEMFVQYALQPLITEYHKVFSEDMLHDTNAVREAHKKIKASMFKIVPIEKAILNMVVRHLPSPQEGQKRKIDSLAPEFKNKTRAFATVRNAIVSCNEVEPIIVYVTKMQPFSARLYNVATRATDMSVSKSNQKLVAVARVYSGKLRVGSKVFVFGANHSAETPDVQEVEIPHIFLLMGSSLEPVNEVGPGCIIGIGGLENVLLKTATLTSTLECPNFSKLVGLSKDLIKVTIEPKMLAQSQELVAGLQQMARADPSVEFHTNQKGENILSTCGEVHLEKCLKDLQDDYAPGVGFEIGDPIIPFKETILNRTTREKQTKVQVVYEELNSSSESSEEEDGDDGNKNNEGQSLTMLEFLERQEEHKLAREMVRNEDKTDPYLEKLFLQKLYRGDQVSLDKLGLKRNSAEDFTANQKTKIKIKAVGLDYLQLTKWLEEPDQQSVISMIHKLVSIDAEEIEEQEVIDIRRFIGEFKKRLIETKTDKTLIRLILDNLQAFGPNSHGSNLLINRYMRKEDSLFNRIEFLLNAQQQRNFEESKVPHAIKNLAPTGSSENAAANDAEGTRKRNKENLQRQGKLDEVLSQFNVMRAEIFNSFLIGFNRATDSGPLCEEPMQGACFIVQNIELVKEEESKADDEANEDGAAAQAQEDDEHELMDTFGSLGGQMISSVQDLCRKAFLNAQPRIAEGMYLCSLVANPENYGIVYNLINKCRGKVISEECQDGTNYFLMDLLIPLVTSFEFHKSVRLQCQGMTYPQLVFNGFLINEEDPFFIPQTEEELEDHGIGDILPENPAKTLIENVRKRKGLIIDKKIVIDGDKQRTLGRNK